MIDSQKVIVETGFQSQVSQCEAVAAVEFFETFEKVKLFSQSVLPLMPCSVQHLASLHVLLTGKLPALSNKSNPAASSALNLADHTFYQWSQPLRTAKDFQDGSQ